MLLLRSAKPSQCILQEAYIVKCKLSPSRVKVYQSCTETLEVAFRAVEAAQKCSCLGSGSRCVKVYIVVAALEAVCVKVQDCSSWDRIEQGAASALGGATASSASPTETWKGKQAEWNTNTAYIGMSKIWQERQRTS